MNKRREPLLSICIPAYNRPEMLNYALDKFILQIAGKKEELIEILITDDASPEDSLKPVRDRAEDYEFIHYRRLENNIGLERNLIECTRHANGEFLWIFGDDDFLEYDDSIDLIMTHLQAGLFDSFIMNKTRRNGSLEELLSSNWMNLDAPDTKFDKLTDLVYIHGFIMILGFVSANIFRRQPFQAVNAEKYFGAMYPQLGVMVEAFHDKPALMISRPLICHRTTTQKEKYSDISHKPSLAGKPSEKDFMSGGNRKSGIYSSHNLASMLNYLIDAGAISAETIHLINEKYMSEINLVQHVLRNVELSLEYPEFFDRSNWSRTKHFFDRIQLSPDQREHITKIISEGLEKTKD
jgi:glycosyltransferase involved in cell wall biosynthesis